MDPFTQGKVAYQFNDIPEAKKRLTYAAKKGHAEAQHLLGEVFEREKAYRSAARWYRLAAWQGRLPRAQFCLARLYYYGYGVKLDVVEAEKWMLAAAEGADTDAMVGMGVIRFNAGKLIEAYAWFRLAAARKSSEGVREARELRASLKGEEGAKGKTAPLHVEDLLLALEEHGIDADGFVTDLRSGGPDLKVLAREIEQARLEEGDERD